MVATDVEGFRAALMIKSGVLVFLLAMLAASPTRAQAPPVAKADQIALLADMLHAIKTSVVQRRRGQEVAAYKAVSFRLAQCAAAYGTLARDVSTDAATRAWYTATTDVYAKASAALYPDTADAYHRTVGNLSDAIMKIRSDQKALFYFLRNCKDFADPKPQAVDNAVIELSNQ
jgi:hypothetical protein